jgi:hypothetical protein
MRKLLFILIAFAALGMGFAEWMRPEPAMPTLGTNRGAATLIRVADQPAPTPPVKVGSSTSILDKLAPSPSAAPAAAASAMTSAAPVAAPAPPAAPKSQQDKITAKPYPSAVPLVTMSGQVHPPAGSAPPIVPDAKPEPTIISAAPVNEGPRPIEIVARPKLVVTCVAGCGDQNGAPVYERELGSVEHAAMLAADAIAAQIKADAIAAKRR